MRNIQGKTNRNKLWLILAVLFLFTVAFWGRAFQLQVLQRGRFDGWKKEQYWRKKELSAKRGRILDRNGNVLAQDIVKYKIMIEPYKIKAKNRKNIFDFLKTNYPSVVKDSALFYSQHKVVLLNRNAGEEEAEHIKTLRSKYKEYFIYTRSYYKRIYPYGKYAGQVLGFVNYAHKGVSGIELYANDMLKGENGIEYTIVAPRGTVLENVDMPTKKAVPGNDVYLTIDLDLQTIAEEELQEAVKGSNAKGGMVVIMQPNSGEIYAISAVPGFDPNEPGKYSSRERKNRAVTDVFEPGSTFKVVAAAALLESGKVAKDSLVYCENGRWKIYNNWIHDHKKYGWLTFEKVLANSSNIGMAKLSRENLSKDFLYKKIIDFGFNGKTGIPLPGEASGLFKSPSKWSGLTQVSLSFGHEIGVTALQLTNAFCVIANGGNYVKPLLVNEIKNYQGKTVLRRQPEVVKRVISEENAEILRDMLGEVVRNGTGTKAALSEISVGGKTGTAQKINNNGSGYSQDQFIASFVGFFPLKKPEFVILVMLDSPNSPFHTGGMIAAPTFKNIVKNVMGIPSFYTKITKQVDDTGKIYVHDFYGEKFSELKEYLEDENIPFEVSGEGEYVVGQNIVNRELNENEKLIIEVDDLNFKTDKLPQLKGKSLKTVVGILNKMQIDFSVSGSGIVVKQYPAAGTDLKNIKKVKLICKAG